MDYPAGEYISGINCPVTRCSMEYAVVCFLNCTGAHWRAPLNKKISKSFTFAFRFCHFTRSKGTRRLQAVLSAILICFFALLFQLTTAISHLRNCSAIWQRQRRWKGAFKADSIRIMATATAAVTIKQHSQRARLRTFRWVSKEKFFPRSRLPSHFNDFPWIASRRFAIFNFPGIFPPLTVWQPLAATQLELRLQCHHTNNSQHTGLVESISELAALRVRLPASAEVFPHLIAQFMSRNESNSRSSYESGFYNSLSRSNSPVNDSHDMSSPSFENRSLADLMVSI